MRHAARINGRREDRTKGILCAENGKRGYSARYKMVLAELDEITEMDE